jgi:hypothetical protein
MQEQNHNIFETFNKEEYKRVRSLMIHCVLATDMSKHFSDLGKFKTRLSAADFDPKSQDKDLTIGVLFHLADISNSTKPW